MQQWLFKIGKSRLDKCGNALTCPPNNFLLFFLNNACNHHIVYMLYGTTVGASAA